MGPGALGAPARQDAAEFLSLLGRLRELHDSEIHALQAEIGRLRACVSHDPASSTTRDTTSPESTAPSLKLLQDFGGTPTETPAPRLGNLPLPSVQSVGDTPPLDSLIFPPLPEAEAVESAGSSNEADEHEYGFEISMSTRTSMAVGFPSQFSRAARTVSDGLLTMSSEKRTPFHGRGYCKPKRWYDVVEAMIQNPIAEGFFALLILVNACIMALEVQHKGVQIGERIGYLPPNAMPDLVSDSALLFFRWSETVFGSMFALELVLKLIGSNRKFHKDPWNWIDAVIVSFWLVGEIGVAAMFFQPNVLRLMRLARLLRLLRLVRMIRSFESLYLMTTALYGCVSVLVWACALLSVVEMMISLLLNQYLYYTYFSDDTVEAEDMRLMYMYFGTFTRTMLSMFEITLGNWPPVSRMLVENSSEWFMPLCVLHKLVIGFAIVGVINGVFMQETFKVASFDDRIMVSEKQRVMKAHQQKMMQLFSEADASRDGCVDVEEFRQILGIPAVRVWLGAMGLDASDADFVFGLIDANQDGQVSLDELVRGVERLQGSARSIDMVALKRDFDKLMTVLEQATLGSTGSDAARQGPALAASLDDNASAGTVVVVVADSPRAMSA